MKKLILLFFVVVAAFTSQSQNLSYTCPRDTVLGCNTPCFTLKAQFPDIRSSSSSYTLENVSNISGCRPYTSPGLPGLPTELTIDDRYSSGKPIGFRFPFFDSTYEYLVVSTNGYISFDTSGSLGFSAWALAANFPSGTYDRALIAGPWHDLDPSVPNSPLLRVNFTVVGSAPNRKWVLNIFKLPLFSGACNPLFENTHQIVLHESTGIVEVFILDKQQCPSWNNGRGMVGMQDYTRAKGIVAPGRAATDAPWGQIGMNEAWRFFPAAGAPAYRSVQLLDATGAVVATGDTTRIDGNTFETSFANVCPPNGTSLYVVKTTYASLTNPGTTLYSLDTINVIKQAALPVTATMTATNCGASTGSITVTAVGTGPFTYTLDGGTPTAPQPTGTYTFTNVNGGTHTVTATDGTGCTNTTTIDVTSINNLTSTISAVAASCPGATNGSVTANPTAGTGPYTFTLFNGLTQVGIPQASGTFSNLPPSTYNVQFTDAAGCSGVTTNILVGSGTALSMTIATVATSCSGNNNGQATITPTSGTGPYTYEMDGNGIFQGSNFFNNLSSGTHNVLIIDANGCTGRQDLFIGSGTSLNIAAPVITAVSCPGVNNGTITITVTNGTGPFTFAIDGGAPSAPQASNVFTFTGLASGLHTMNVVDATNCAGTRTGSVGSGAGIQGTATSTPTSCPGVNDGTVTGSVNAGSGTGPYTYAIDGSSIFQGSPTFPGQAAGVHVVTFKDANGCTGTASVTVLNGTALVASSVFTNTTCPGVNDGTLTITPPATGGPFSYTLNPIGTIQNNNPVFTGLAPGTYSVVVTNAVGCQGTINANTTISNGLAPSTVAGTTQTSCPTVNDGVVTVTAPATGGPFVYTLNPGNIVQNNNPVFTGLAPGNYTITFTTAIGCNGTVPVNPVVAPGPVLTPAAPAITNPACANINDGVLTINPSVPGNHTYILNPGTATQVTQINNPTFTGLAPGTYNYSFTNAVGCVGTGSATLTTNAPLATTVSLTMPLCFNNANGSITLNPAGGVAPYEYATGPAFTNWQSSNVITGLTANTYTIRIRDNVGCIKDTTVVLSQPTLLTASATSTPGTCNGNDGQITVTGNGGTPAYSYSVDNGANYQSSASFVVSGGNFPDILVRDANGCVANTNVNVVLIDNMFLIPMNDTTICVESSVTLQPNLSNEATVFDWTAFPDASLTNTLDDSTIKFTTATPQDTTTYVLIAQWGVCTRTDTVRVNILHKPVAHAGDDVWVCNYKRDTVLVGSATNVSGPVRYEWAPANLAQTPDSFTTVVIPDSTQVFTLTVYDEYGCNFAETDQVTVTVQPPVPAFAGNDTLAVAGVPHQLWGSGGVSYQWAPAAPLDLSTAQNPLATLNSDQLFSVVVTDAQGCLGADSVFIQVYTGPRYYVPSSFTPNGDGLNDIFRAIPVGIAYTDWFRVYNRFGQLVFQTNRWLKGWDGFFLGKRQPQGTYVWMIKGIDKYGKVVEEKGTVLLLQ